jgi:hypothetical protein
MMRMACYSNRLVSTDTSVVKDCTKKSDNQQKTSQVCTYVSHLLPVMLYALPAQISLYLMILVLNLPGP